MFDPERDGLGGTFDGTSVDQTLSGEPVQPEPVVSNVPPTPLAQMPQPAQVAQPPAPPAPKGFDKNTLALIAVLGLLYWLLSRRKA